MQRGRGPCWVHGTQRRSARSIVEDELLAKLGEGLRSIEFSYGVPAPMSQPPWRPQVCQGTCRREAVALPPTRVVRFLQMQVPESVGNGVYAGEGDLVAWMHFTLSWKLKRILI
ncbi:hypothetical protein SORBI_3004G125600 [Sorghum bicolor]|uniref:Uncharacterized protein n=1 Tax=Sorghum bicolor TaxID=4558 RepID=A0A194YPB3_SORBI|nr:hypothetical protein SORBI_3004G125600 [Sorghum bicolor]